MRLIERSERGFAIALKWVWSEVRVESGVNCLYILGICSFIFSFFHFHFISCYPYPPFFKLSLLPSPLTLLISFILGHSTAIGLFWWPPYASSISVWTPGGASTTTSLTLVSLPGPSSQGRQQQRNDSQWWLSQLQNTN